MENLNGITLMRAEAHHQRNPQPGGRERHRRRATNLKREYDNGDSISPVMVAARRAEMRFPWVCELHSDAICAFANQPGGRVGAEAVGDATAMRNVQLLS